MVTGQYSTVLVFLLVFAQGGGGGGGRGIKIPPFPTSGVIFYRSPSISQSPSILLDLKFFPSVISRIRKTTDDTHTLGNKIAFRGESGRGCWGMSGGSVKARILIIIHC